MVIAIRINNVFWGIHVGKTPDLKQAEYSMIGKYLVRIMYHFKVHREVFNLPWRELIIEN